MSLSDDEDECYEQMEKELGNFTWQISLKERALSFEYFLLCACVRLNNDGWMDGGGEKLCNPFRILFIAFFCILFMMSS